MIYAKKMKNIVNDETKLYNNSKTSMDGKVALLTKEIEHLKKIL